jgi:conjugative transposon TraM protein
VKNQIKSPKMLRQRKFFLMLPILTLPFITLMFWAFGGGKVSQANAQSELQTGLLLNLPDATLKDDKALTKMDFYNQAMLDSARLKDLIRNDPNYRKSDASTMSYREEGLNTSLNSSTRYNDPNEEKIYRKLAELDRELNSSYHAPKQEPFHPQLTDNTPSESLYSADIDRLEQLMQTLNDTETEDEEMKQINAVLETILDIQHPNRVQQRINETSVRQKGVVYPVEKAGEELPVSLLSAAVEDYGISNGFYSLNDSQYEQTLQNAIEAVVHETQTLVNGSIVKLRLTNDVVINGVNIPKDNFLFGQAQINGERLGIKISSIRYNNALFPVELLVYDLDGLDGIYIPGAITREAAKESADRSIQTIGLSTLDPSIQAAKTLLSRKAKLVKVTVKAGYQVLLRDQKLKQDNF